MASMFGPREIARSRVETQRTAEFQQRAEPVGSASPQRVRGIARVTYAVRELARESKEAAPVARESRSHPPREYLTPDGDVHLVVRSPGHSDVRVSGFGRFFPAGTVHVEDSTGVVAANNCRLTAVDHYHVRRAVVSMEPLRNLSSAAGRTLTILLEDPSNSSAISAFQRSLKPSVSQQEARGNPEVSRPVAGKRRVVIKDCADVQTGDGSVMKKTTQYVAEETVLPLVDLLVHDRALVEGFARAVREPQSGGATASFYRRVLKAAGRVDDLTRLAQTPDLEQVPNTTLFSFFSSASVHDAAAVMIGSGNELRARTNVELPGIHKHDFITDLDKVRQEQPPGGPGISL